MSNIKLQEMPDRYHSLVSKKFQLETRLIILKKKKLDETKDYHKILEEIQEVKEDLEEYSV